MGSQQGIWIKSIVPFLQLKSLCSSPKFWLTAAIIEKIRIFGGITVLSPNVLTMEKRGRNNTKDINRVARKVIIHEII